MSREQRRSFLLDRAATLVAEFGVGALTFESLAAAAGVTKSLPYAYFESPDEILLELFASVIGDLDDEVRAAHDAGGEFDEIVRRSLEVWFDAASERGRLVGALLDGRSVAGLRAAIRRRDQASLRLWRDLVVERYGLRDVDALVVASMLTSTATAVVDLWVRRKGTRADLIDSFVALATNAVPSGTPAS